MTLDKAQSNRYIGLWITTSKSSSQLMTCLAVYDPFQMRTVIRMDQSSFEALLSVIEEVPQIINISMNSPMPVRHQLIVALNRLSRDGNGASHTNFTDTFAISEGSVLNLTTRVEEAL